MVTSACVDRFERWVRGLDQAFRFLATPPSMGRGREELAADLRSLPFGRNFMVCKPLHDGIDVVRVLHMARDIDAAFVQAPQALHCVQGPESRPSVSAPGQERRLASSGGRRFAVE